MPVINHPAMLAQQFGRPKGSKNKAITAAKLTQKVRELAHADKAPERIYSFLLSYLDNDKAKDSERIKAAKFLLDKFIVDANVDQLVDNKPVIESPEEALAILQALDKE